MNSFPQITSVSNGPGNVMVSFPSSSTRFFQLEANTSLTNANGVASIDHSSCAGN
ncbi:MAG: hypothetical protein GKR87_08640 [Kiritimatiellae bacterium]|nr:hypothetical protein [Kiritimatiellia bacterium]